VNAFVLVVPRVGGSGRKERTVGKEGQSKSQSINQSVQSIVHSAQ